MDEGSKNSQLVGEITWKGYMEEVGFERYVEYIINKNYSMNKEQKKA